jgi:hypothetical protein
MTKLMMTRKPDDGKAARFQFALTEYVMFFRFRIIRYRPMTKFNALHMKSATAPSTRGYLEAGEGLSP